MHKIHITAKKTNNMNDDKVKLVIKISKIADDLLRQNIRRKGDLSRIVENLIIEKFGQQTENRYSHSPIRRRKHIPIRTP
jgi:hypothetical protein